MSLTTETGEATCATGAFAEEFGVIRPGESASIELSRATPECDPGYKTQGYTSVGGNWSFEPDDPLIGSSSLECSVEGNAANYIRMNVSGLTCVVTNIEETLSASAGPGGTIECDVEGSGYGTCASSYPYGAFVSVRIVPDHGKYLKESSANGSAAGCTTECFFTLEENSTVSASFGPKYGLTVAKSGHGKVDSAPSGIACSASSCTAEFDGGTTVTLTAAADAGYEFAGWIGCPGSEPTCEITLEAASEVKAIFLKAAAQGEKGETGATGETVPQAKRARQVKANGRHRSHRHHRCHRRSRSHRRHRRHRRNGRGYGRNRRHGPNRRDRRHGPNRRDGPHGRNGRDRPHRDDRRGRRSGRRGPCRRYGRDGCHGRKRPDRAHGSEGSGRPGGSPSCREAGPVHDRRCQAQARMAVHHEARLRHRQARRQGCVSGRRSCCGVTWSLRRASLTSPTGA